MSFAQIGNDIDGEAQYDKSGRSVSLSADGSIVAIGATGNDNDSTGSSSGHVRLYAWDESESKWVQRGSDIDGDAANDLSGSSVSLSADGSIVAIGATNNDGNGNDSGHVRLYAWDASGSEWVQRGGDIDGEAANNESGTSVSLSGDGSIVAIGAYNDGSSSESGHVRLYQWDASVGSSGDWAQLGSDIDGEAASDESGISVSLSSDGRIVAIGSRNNDGNDSSSGHVRLYEWDGSDWVQRGSDIDGEAEYDGSGTSVSLSGDGSIVAIGASITMGLMAWVVISGHVRLYQWDANVGSSGDWIQLGNDIDGENVDDNSGISVSLSNDGSIIAIGAHDNANDNGGDSGHVRLYKWDGSSWVQLGIDIDGEAQYDESGFSVSISSDGSIVAIGATKNDGNGSNSGHVRIFKLEDPTIAISSDVSSLKAGEIAELTFTLSESSSDFIASDITATGGALSNFSGSGTTYTATFTPTENSTTNGEISVASTKFSNVAGHINDDGSDSNNKVTLSIDTLIPVFSAAATSTDGSKIILTYNEALSTVLPISLAFKAKVDGTLNAITSVEVVNSTVELIVDSTIQKGQTVTIAYSDLTSVDDINAIQDQLGNDAATFNTTSATNLSTISNTNDSPTGTVTIIGTATEGHTLTAINNLADGDGLGSVSYQWKRAGAAISGATTSTYSLVQADVGSVITVTASYSDGQGNAENISSAATSAVLNINDPPTGSVIVIGTATQGQTLTASNTLADADVLGSISYQWLRDGAAITDATSSTYTLSQLDVGSVITVFASYTDGQGTAETVTSSATFVVANVNDAPVGSVKIEGQAQQGQTLTAANSLADLDGLGSISYQWNRAGAAITGATASTYTLGQVDVGSAISVTASYTDGQGTAESEISAATSVVANVNDAPTGSVTISGTATEGETLTAANTLADADGLGSIGYQWKRDGTAITGATASTYSLVQADVGSVITVTASYTDGQDTAESLTSRATSIVVDATAPAAPSALDLVAASDSGLSEIDNFTNNTSPRFIGRAEANSSVELFADSLLLGGATANGLSEWIFTIPNTSAFTDGSYAITATATDSAGNTSAASAVLDLSIDTTAPAFTSANSVASIAKTSGSNSLIYKAVATDASSLRYGFKADNNDDAALFSIDSITGEVSLTEAVDDGIKNSYHFVVTAIDNAGNRSEHNVSTAEMINRLYNASTDTHLFTSNLFEIDSLMNNGWTDEGTFGCAPREATADIFRFYIASEGRHFYTALEYERDLIIGNQDFTDAGWTYEGKAFSGHSTSDYPNDAVAVVRYLNQESGNHVYSTSTFEQGILDQDSNWINEGIAWYGNALPSTNDFV